MSKFIRFDKCRGCEEKKAEFQIPLKSLGFYIPVCESCIEFVLTTVKDELQSLRDWDIQDFKHPFKKES
jgi:hypothetical protein